MRSSDIPDVVSVMTTLSYMSNHLVSNFTPVSAQGACQEVLR